MTAARMTTERRWLTHTRFVSFPWPHATAIAHLLDSCKSCARYVYGSASACVCCVSPFIASQWTQRRLRPLAIYGTIHWLVCVVDFIENRFLGRCRMGVGSADTQNDGKWCVPLWQWAADGIYVTLILWDREREKERERAKMWRKSKREANEYLLFILWQSGNDEDACAYIRVTHGVVLLLAQSTKQHRTFHGIWLYCLQHKRS